MLQTFPGFCKKQLLHSPNMMLFKSSSIYFWTLDQVVWKISESTSSNFSVILNALTIRRRAPASPSPDITSGDSQQFGLLSPTAIQSGVHRLHANFVSTQDHCPQSLQFERSCMNSQTDHISSLNFCIFLPWVPSQKFVEAK